MDKVELKLKKAKNMQEQHIDESRSLLKKKRWRELASGNHLAQRLLLFVIILTVLTWFLHFYEVTMDILEIGTRAPRYVISQTAFDFLDRDATQKLKAEAVRDIGLICKIDVDQVRSFRHDFEYSLIEGQKWRQELMRSTFDEVYAILDKIEENLLEVRLSDERTFNEMNALGFSTQYFAMIQTPFQEGELLVLPSALWNKIHAALEANSRFHLETIDFLLSAFSEHTWQLQEDFSLERSIRQQVQSRVPDRYTHIEAGTMIIKKGEKVSSSQIAMLISMKNAMAKARNPWTPASITGSALIALCLLVASIFYLHFFHRDVLKSLQKLTLLVTILVLSILLAKATEYILVHEGKNLVEVVRFPIIVPFASLLICVLIGGEIAMFSSFFLLILFVITLAIDYIPFTLINLLACMVTILFARKLHRRKHVFAVFGKVGLCILPFIVAYNLYGGTLFSSNFVSDLLSSFLFLLVTAIISTGLLPVFESLFQVMTDMTLMEYMDPDHELLRRLSLEAPGTYQHCLVVGNLSEAGARAIGANGLFCRVSTLYHDIGKLFNPHYFTENQLGGFNIHQLLTPTESTHVIIAHVPEGEALARKYHLPQSFIDVIREHHGSTMVYYFYCKQVEQMGGDPHKVNERLFRYPGPKPRSKESAIIMIADTVEAASRSMDEATEEKVAEMVDKLVAEKADDGQFDECQLTFEELGRVKKAIVKALTVTRHLRIKYPDPQ